MLKLDSNRTRRVFACIGIAASIIAVVGFITGFTSLLPIYKWLSSPFIKNPLKNPKDAYAHFYSLARQGDWDASYDLLDRASRVRMEYETKAALLSFASDDLTKERIRQLDGRRLWEIVMRFSTFHDRQILECELNSDTAKLKTRTSLDGKPFVSFVYMQKEDGIWKVSWPKADQPVFQGKAPVVLDVMKEGLK